MKETFTLFINILMLFIVLFFSSFEIITLVGHFGKKRSTAIPLADHGEGRQRGLSQYIQQLEVLNWPVSVNKHSS